MDNKSKKSSFLKNLLATASIASVIVGGSTAFAAANRETDGADAVFRTGAGLNLGGATPFVTGSSLKYDNLRKVNANLDGGQTISYIDLHRIAGDGAQDTFTVTTDTVINSITNTAVGGPNNVLPFAIAAGRSLTIGGRTVGAIAPAAVLVAEHVGPVNFGGDNGVLNITTGAGAGAGAGFAFAPRALDFTMFKVVNGANATLNIDNKGENTKFGQAEVATANIINIFDDSIVEFDSTASARAPNTLDLQQGANSRINFGNTGNGTLLFTSNANAANFTVINGSLIGVKDGEGKIHFNTHVIAGTLSHVVANKAVVGTRKDLRVQKFTVTAGAVNAATIVGGVYTKELELLGGRIIFNGEVDVGDQGVTNIKAATNLDINVNSNLGTTNFHNVPSTITVGVNKTLQGNFYANKQGSAGAVRNGTIVFQGNGELSGTGDNLIEIRSDAAGTLKLSGDHNVTELKGMVLDTHFTFAKDYKLTGNINETVGAGVPGVGSASNLTFEGNAEIIGNIGNIGAAGAGAVGKITIPKDAIVTVKGATIRANDIFKDAGGGTLKLNNGADVTITSTISANGGGTIDATEMTASKTLTIVGTIGMDPAGADPKGLDKLLLKEQKLNFNLATAANKWVNIAGIDFGGRATTVKMDVAANYAFGALTNAEESTFEVHENVSLYKTTTSGLKEVKFTADNKILTLHKDNDITAQSITSFGRAQGGDIVFAGNATLKGAIGDSVKKFNNLTVNDGVTAITSGSGFFGGNIELGDGSTLVVDSNYTANAVVGKAPGKGILKFVNAAGTGVKLTTAAANAANNGIAILELNGGDVALEGNGIKFSTIKFTSTAAASLTLAPQMKLDGINVVSTLKDARPTVVLSAIDHSIDKAIGTDRDHLVNLQFTGDNTINVSTPSFFGVTTKNDNQGTVNFKAAPHQVYGLGSEGRHLKAATFEVNTENFGDTYVNNGIINDNVVYKAGGMVASRLQVGSDKGGSVAEFKDGVILTAAMTSKGDNNKINFTNDAEIGANLGAENARFKAITFNGNQEALLYNAAMYAEIVDFTSENIISLGDNIISGTSRINRVINLTDGKLIFQDNQNNIVSTWGPNTVIATTLTPDGKLGSIEVNTPIDVLANVPVHAIIVKDKAQLGADQEYKLIAKGKNLRLVNGAQFGPLTGVETDQPYAQWTVHTKDDKDVYLLRSNGAATIAPIDIKAVGGDEKDQENAALLGRESLAAMTDIGLLSKDPKVRGIAIQQLVNTENRLVTEAIEHANVGIANLVGARLAQVDQQKPVGSGSDDVAGESMGAWAMPYYNQAIQKGEGSVVGYKTKSVGGVLGFDALASENLTIGAAVSIVRTDMKYKDYKFGEKTDINTVMLSLYGSQQLDKDFFVQGLVSFGSNKIKNSDPRKVPTSRNASGQQIAKASYDSLSYGGQVLFGYNAKVSDSVLLTPMAGIRYTGSSDEGYKETNTDNVNKVVGKKTSNKVEAVLGTRFAVSVDASGITVMPEVHAFVSQKLVGSLGKVNAKLDGMTSSFATRSDKAAKTLFNLGLGVTAKAGNMEYGAGYDAYLASKYVGHQGTLKVRVNF